MITPRITCCKDCPDILNLIKQIDCKLYEIGLDIYNNIVFGLNLTVDTKVAFDLLHYKRILSFKLVNDDYACEFDTKLIESKVKKYTSMCRKNCMCEDKEALLLTTTTTTTVQTVFTYNFTQGELTSILSCASSNYNLVLYSDVPNLNVANSVFIDNTLTTVYNGGDLYYKDQVTGDSYQIASDGGIISVTIC